MNSERSVLKYMEFFANKAIEGKGITDIATGDVIKDEKKFNENYTTYNAMMAGYFMCSKEYHDQILYRKYLNDIVKTEGTPADFVGLINSVRLEEVFSCVEKKVQNTSKTLDWYKKLFISIEMGIVSHSIINNLDSNSKKEYQNAIYDMAYRFDENFNERLETPEITSKLNNMSKVLKNEKKLACN